MMTREGKRSGKRVRRSTAAKVCEGSEGLYEMIDLERCFWHIFVLLTGRFNSNR